MAEISLTNQVDVNGLYGDASSPISFSSNIENTTIVEGFTITKTANKTYWIDGVLTYTIVVDNKSGNTLTMAKLTDNLNTDLIEFNSDYGVKIDNESSSSYTYNSGKLEITLPELATDNSTTITFQVTKKQ